MLEVLEFQNMTKWELKKEETGFDEETRKKYGPVISQLLANRNLVTLEEIENFFQFDYEKNIIDPLEIPEVRKAVERIEKAKERKEKIAVFGDYDADGVTALVVICETLTDLGIAEIVPYIPDRQIEGYGMNLKALEFLKNEGVKLIITVDCGITNHEEVKKAGEWGMDVIVTDHHHVGKTLPEAVAVINPHRDNSGFNFHDFAGVGVAFKLAQALYKKIQPKKIDQLKWALDIVAIGTIADCVPLLGENRVLAKYGLIVLAKTRRAGLQEMFKVGRITIDENNIPDARKVAFQVAPRINAAGRVDHANTSYKLIIEKDRAKARDLALEVEGKNQERQKITGEIVREVKILAENLYKDKKMIFAANSHWPVGILGLVAGKIADEFRKPVIVLQDQSEELVGSLRSIPAVNIIEMLEKCSDLLIRFGGHAQAAGLTMKKENADKFFERAEKIVSDLTPAEAALDTLDIDAEITPEGISWDLMDMLKKMEPFGEGNPEPVFLMKNLKIYELKICGNGSKHLKLSLGAQSGSPKIFDSIGFGLCEKFPDLKTDDIIDIVFNLSEDSWNGNKKMQIKIIDLKIHG